MKLMLTGEGIVSVSSHFSVYCKFFLLYSCLSDFVGTKKDLMTGPKRNNELHVLLFTKEPHCVSKSLIQHHSKFAAVLRHATVISLQ